MQLHCIKMRFDRTTIAKVSGLALVSMMICGFLLRESTLDSTSSNESVEDNRMQQPLHERSPPHAQLHTPARTTKPTKAHPFQSGSGSSEVNQCAGHPGTIDRVRIERYRTVCERQPIQTNKHVVHLAFLDKRLKTFGCINHKAGSSSWKGFMLLYRDPSITDFDSYKHRILGPNGLHLMTDRIDPSMMETTYRNWTKYIVVRHPLQRFVSGYYEIMARKMKFPKFVKAVVEDDLFNIHWMRITEGCQVCDVPYEYVFKQETIDDDVLLFHKEVTGTHVNTTVPKHRVKEIDLPASLSTVPHMNKYDHMLADIQRTNPEHMKKVLARYQDDMDLFGYGWDWENMQSTCIQTTDKSKCC